MLSTSRTLVFLSQKLQKPISGNLKTQSKALSTIFNNHGKLEIIENIQLKNKAYLRINFQGLQLKNEALPATCKSMCSAPPVKKEKAGISVLGKLRKQTGYSLSLCKKALNNCDQDLEKAKQWLEEQAQAQGWNKANKLEGRNTSQGLIGACLSSDERTATLVELNSETDFVARNNQFHSLLNNIISIVTEKAEKISGEQITTNHIEKAVLDKIPTSQDKTLADLVALNIGQIGENIILSRAATISTNESNTDNIKLAIVTHPSANPTASKSNVAYGRFGVIIAYSKKDDVGILPEGQTVDSLARQLCQHIIGMNPSSLGNIHDTSSWPRSKKENIPVHEPEKSELDEGVKEDENWTHLGEDKSDSDSSNELIHQPFLLNTEILVRDLLLQTGIEVKTFLRFELGGGQN